MSRSLYITRCPSTPVSIGTVFNNKAPRGPMAYRVCHRNRSSRAAPTSIDSVRAPTEPTGESTYDFLADWAFSDTILGTTHIRAAICKMDCMEQCTFSM